MRPILRLLRWHTNAVDQAGNADVGSRYMVAMRCGLGRHALELAVCCPALAWKNARPWGVHVSRLRLRDILPPTTPAVLHSLPLSVNVIPLDNAVQPAADNYSDGIVLSEWAFAQDRFAV